VGHQVERPWDDITHDSCDVIIYGNVGASHWSSYILPSLMTKRNINCSHPQQNVLLSCWARRQRKPRWTCDGYGLRAPLSWRDLQPSPRHPCGKA